MARRTWTARSVIDGTGRADDEHGALTRRRPTARLLLAPLLAIVLLAGLGAASAYATNKAPAVTKQPLNQTVEAGQSATFSSTASGIPTPTVQWERSVNGGASWSPIEGATSSPLTVPNTSTSEDGYQYRAVFKNVAGEIASKAATLTVRQAPAVTQQPAAATVEEGQNAVFQAAASGFPAPTVQWQTSSNGGASWANVSGATSDQLTVVSAKTSISGHQYRAIFTNVAGKATSEAATLTVQKAPTVTKQPVATTVEAGQNAVFEAAASGFPAPTVQWEVSTDGGSTWNTVEGATSAQLTVTAATTSENGYEYRATFTNAAGAVQSQAATLTVRALPVVTQQPSGTTVEVGEPATFEAAASGFPAPTVQWELSTNGGGTWAPVTGATSTQLTIESSQAGESGHEYRAVFTNAAGKAVSAAATLTVATNHYNAMAWGQNLFRQLGDGSFNASSDVPVQVSGLKFVTSVAAGGRHSLALVASGAVVAWGDNEFGQLGNGTTTTSNVPVPVSGLTGVKAIAAGANHSLALLSNGTVVAWGDNESGQLGTGSTLESEVPVAVKGLTGVRAIAAGANHSLALLSNGTVMAWGDNESGQLGTGSTKSSTVPVAVKGLSGVSEISAGGSFSLALLSKGTVEAWGDDTYGQLGNSTVEEGSSDVPVAVSTLTGVTAIAAGDQHSLALLGTGTVMAWGEDSFGELGNGVIKTREETPVPVTGLSGVTTISAGGQDSVALLGSGSVMTWGINQWGTLGDGASGSPSDVPVTVNGLDKAASVSAGGSHMLAFGEPLPVVTGVTPNIGPTSGGGSVTISGANLTGATAVHFGGAEAKSVTVNSATSISATAPAGTGTVDVTVTTPAGISAPGPADRYTFAPPPAITKLLPKTGPTLGATSVTLTGTNFTAATQVTFGGTNAIHFTVNSATSITAESPPETAGTVDVIVTTPGGPSAATSKDHFAYAPAIESVSPNGGSTLGGTSVTVTGSGFALGSVATTFKFGKVKAGSVNCTSSTSCTMTAPAQPAGTVDVVATVNKVNSPLSAADHFTYS